jgi:hypothetical protein
MTGLSTLLEKQRRELDSRGKWYFFGLLAAFGLSAGSFGMVLTQAFPAGGVEGPWSAFLTLASDQALEMASVFLTIAAGSVVMLWRVHHQKVTLLIAQAFMQEGDTDSAVRMLLGGALGGDPGQMGLSKFMDLR